MDHRMSKVSDQGARAKPQEAWGVYSIFIAKYRLNLLYFNTFFLQNLIERKKGGIITRAKKVEGIYPIPSPTWNLRPCSKW